MTGAIWFSLIRGFFISAALMLVLVASAYAGGPDCASCHEAALSGKNVHPAVAMGCASCHSALDAAEVPHTMTGKNPKGLGAKMRDLCFTCHDKQPFMKSTVHGAIRLGCSSCHNPHTSDHARLLKDEQPGLCLTCHQQNFAEGAAKRHILTHNENCIECHDPHSTDTPKLVKPVPTTPSASQHARIMK
jgi:predicted CXXCH cytochrome family protein